MGSWQGRGPGLAPLVWRVRAKGMQERDDIALAPFMAGFLTSLRNGCRPLRLGDTSCIRIIRQGEVPA